MHDPAQVVKNCEIRLNFTARNNDELGLGDNAMARELRPLETGERDQLMELRARIFDESVTASDTIISFVIESPLETSQD